MDNIEITPPSEGIESPEGGQARQALEDATYDPGSYVEQTVDVGTSEGIEKDITSLVENITQSAEQAKVQPDRPVKEIDPTTGETSTSGGSGSSGEGDEETWNFVADKEDLVDALVRDENGIEKAGNKLNEIQGARKEWDKPYEIDESHVDPDKGPQTVGSPTIGKSGEGTYNDSTDPESPFLDHELPEARRTGVGMGPHGMIEKGVNTTKGGLLGGQGSSGGGPPVSGHGPGSKGTDGGQELPFVPQKLVDAINQGLKDGIYTKEEAEVLEKYLQEMVLEGLEAGGQVSLTPEGVTPMPYTGSGGGGAKPEPSTVGGPGGDSGKFTPIVSVDGKIVWGGADTNVYVGYGSSGSSTFSPDGGGEADDSGKYHGGLTGSAERPNNPDDPDYYTPHELQEALKANIQTQASNKKET